MTTVGRYRPQPVSAPTNSPVVRTSSRPREFRQPDFDQRFDPFTIFFDVTFDQGRVVMNGPPLREFEELLRESTISFDGELVSAPLQITELVRGMKAAVDCEMRPNTMSVSNQWWSVETTVGHPQNERFRDRKVLFTLSKDNRLEAIADWAKFHVVNHGVDAVLFYDNASNAYSPDEIEQTLAAVDGIEVVCVVEWPFPYGPPGGRFAGSVSVSNDELFCQTGVMENARVVHLREASGVINADIDEFVVPLPSGSVFDLVNKSPRGFIRYGGTWIEPTFLTHEPDDEPRHSDFGLFNERRLPSDTKWAAKPSMIPETAQWRTHLIEGVAKAIDGRVDYGHFLGINTNWKFDRTQVRDQDQAKDRLHLPLVTAMKRAFPERYTSSHDAAIDAMSQRSATSSSECLLRAFEEEFRASITTPSVEVVHAVGPLKVHAKVRCGDMPLTFSAHVTRRKVHVTATSSKAHVARLQEQWETLGLPLIGPRPNGVRMAVWNLGKKEVHTHRSAAQEAAALMDAAYQALSRA